jgi:hypothetical protein
MLRLRSLQLPVALQALFRCAPPDLKGEVSQVRSPLGLMGISLNSHRFEGHERARGDGERGCATKQRVYPCGAQLSLPAGFRRPKVLSVQLRKRTNDANESTGVVAGEFGFVHALREKKRVVETWLSDSRPRVAQFAERYIPRLDTRIASHQREAVQRREMRRRDYERDDDDESDERPE